MVGLIHHELQAIASYRPKCGVWLYRRAKDLIQSNIAILHKTADVLMEREQIDGEEFQRIILEAQAEQYLKADEPQITVPYKDAVPA